MSRATVCFSMYSDMSMRIIARSSSNRNSASARASSVLPTPVGPRNRNEPIGRLGSLRPERARRTALATATLGVGHGLLGRLDLFLDLAEPPDACLLGLPLRSEGVAPLLELGQLGVDAGQAIAGRGVVLVASDRDALDLQLHGPPLDLVD